MISRVTTQMLQGSAQRNMQLSLSALQQLQEKATTQREISRPSDNPAATSAALSVRSQIRAVDQYSANIDDGTGWLAKADSALTTSTRILQRVRDLTVQGSNTGALSAQAREAIAVELETLRTDLLAQANTTYQGRSIFAGNSGAGVAFAPDYSHTGAPGSVVERRVSDDATVRVDADGVAAFGAGTTSVFALVDTIVAGLRAGTSVATHLVGIDAGLNSILGQQAVVGARSAQLERGKVVMADAAGSLENQRAGIEDVDLSRVIIDLKTQEVAYQSALAVTARALQPTLMSFLS